MEIVGSRYVVDVDYTPRRREGDPEPGGLDMSKTRTHRVVVEADSQNEAMLVAAQMVEASAGDANLKPRTDQKLGPGGWQPSAWQVKPEGMVTRTLLVGQEHTGSTIVPIGKQHTLYPAEYGGKYHKVNTVTGQALCRATVLCDMEQPPIMVHENQERIHPIVCKRCFPRGEWKTAGIGWHVDPAPPEQIKSIQDGRPVKVIYAVSDSGDDIGYLSWYVGDKSIDIVAVDEAWRRKGVASALLEAARKFDPEIKHSEHLSEDGRAWQEKTGARVHDLYGANSIDAMFPDGAPITSSPFGRARRMKAEPLYDRDVVSGVINDPNKAAKMAEFDPRELSGIQGQVTRQGVQHYLSGEYERSGRTFADHDQKANEIPLVYVKPSGEQVILIGHHRAAAALLKGEPLHALRVEAPHGNNPRHAAPVPRHAAAGSVDDGPGSLGPGSREGDRPEQGGGAPRGIVGQGRPGAGRTGSGPAAADGEAGLGPAVAAERHLRLYRGERPIDAQRPLIYGDMTGRFFTPDKSYASKYLGDDGHLYHIDLYGDENYYRYNRHEIVLPQDLAAAKVHSDECPRCRTAAADSRWRPTRGMFAPGQPTLDPRFFDVTTEQMRPEVRAAILKPLNDFMLAQGYADWMRWMHVYLTGSGASYWWDSDKDCDILLTLDLDVLRQSRPANLDVDEADIDAHFDRLFKEQLDPATAETVFSPGEQPCAVTYFVNPGKSITDIKPYACYDLTEDTWVVHPPVLPADWGPQYLPDEIWRECEEMARAAEGVLSLPDPQQRHEACVDYFDWIHHGRQIAYGPHGKGWLDIGNVAWQYLSQHPDRILARLYAEKHDPAFQVTAGAGGQDYTGLTFTHEDQDEHWPHTVHVFHPEHGWLGQLQYDERSGEIVDVGVKIEHQRRGVARQLLEEARRVQPDVHHSNVQTEEGEEWARHTAGPASGRIPRALRRMISPGEINKPRPVVLDPPAEDDLDHLPGDIRKALVAAVQALEDGRAQLEAKARELAGAFSLRLTNKWRAAVYLGAESFWHLFWIGDHNYEEAERRFSSLSTTAASSRAGIEYHQGTRSPNGGVAGVVRPDRGEQWSRRAALQTEAVKPFGYDDLDGYLERVFHPQRLDARKEKHPKSGWMLPVGEERQLDHVADDVPDNLVGIPARLKVVDRGPIGAGMQYGPNGKFLRHEPLQSVYRGMSMDEYNQAMQRGYIQSDKRGVISQEEGTNAAVEPQSALSYLPPGQHGMVVRIKARPEHDWRMIRADGYVRSQNQIPVTDIEQAAPFSKTDEWRLYPGHIDQSLLHDKPSMAGVG